MDTDIKIAYNKIGFHCGPAGNHNGIGEYMRQLDTARIPFVIKSVDHYGHCFEAAQYSNAGHVVVFRLSTRGQNDGFDYDVPRYDLTPADAARVHWEATLAKLPPEFDRERVWLEVINEVDKGRSNWLGHFAAEIGKLALMSDYKLLLFGWSAGEPEQTDWQTAGMLRYLRLCADNPGQLGISLHEYSYDKNDIWRLAGDLIGRYERLFEVCDAHNLPHPPVVITEWGWEYRDVPRPNHALEDIAAVAELYASSPALLGAAIWYLGGDFGNIHNQTQKLIEPVTIYSLQAEFEVDDEGQPPPPPPIEPPPPPTAVNRLTNGSFEDGWEDVNYNGLVNQRPEGWALACALPGESAFGAINHKTGEPAKATAVPECIHKLARQLPPSEQPGGEDALILEGTAVYKIFAANNAFAARLGQIVTGLEPGAEVQAIVPVRVHYHDALNEPDDVEVWVEINDERMVVLAEDLPHRTWIHIVAQGVADAEGTAVVRVTVVTKWRNSRDFFFDDLRLVVLEGETPPIETLPYPPEVTHVILRPQSLTGAQWERLRQLMGEGYQGIRPGFEGWAHTTSINAIATAVNAGYTNSRLIVLDGDQIGTGLDANWMKVNHPELLPYTRFVSSAAQPVDPPVDPPPPPAVDTLDVPTAWQRDPRWRDAPCGFGPRTIGNWGCLLTVYQMMAEFWGIHEGRDVAAENVYYRENGGFYSDFLVSMALSKVYPAVRNEGWLTREDSRMRLKARQWLDAGIPVPARVDFNPATPRWEQHWVLLTGYDGDHFYMNDPWTGKGGVRVNDVYGIVGSDLLECLFYLPPSDVPAPPPPPVPSGRASFGLHADARGGDISAEELDIFRTAEIGMVKVLSGTSAHGVHQLRQACPTARWVVRAFLDFGGRHISPEQFVHDTLPDVQRTLDALRGVPDVVVELHNEPNLVQEGLGTSWADGAGFNDWYLAVLALYRQALPGVRFLFPGLSPGGNNDIRQAHRPFMQACAEAIAASDGLAVHVYWAPPHGYPLYGHADSGVTLLQDFVWIFPRTKIWVTEASNNREGTSPQRRADEYVEFWQACRRLPSVQGVTYFVASAAPGTYEHETWDMALAEQVAER